MKELFQLMAVLNILYKQQGLSEDRVLLYVYTDLSGYIYVRKGDRLQPLFEFSNEDDLIQLLKAEIGEITYKKMIKDMNGE